MAKMYFNTPGCMGATSGITGREYTTDRAGFINVTDPADIKAFKEAGYGISGGMPRVDWWWACECGWEALIPHCPKCDRDDLVKTYER